MDGSSDSSQLTRALWDLFSRMRDPGTRAELIERYMPLARIVAATLYGRRRSPSSSFDDYLQYGRVGLIESVDRYDVTRGVSFESFATHRIRGAILNGIRQESEVAAQREFWRTQIPDRMQSALSARGINPRHASLDELVHLAVTLALGLILDADGVEPIDDSIEGNPYAAAEIEQLSRRLRQLVEKLPERERAIVKGHYFEQLEFQIIAERFALTKGRVSQIHGRALGLLREMVVERLDRKV